MEKEFVPYELALRLKALGFDEPCFGFYQLEYGEIRPIMVDDDEQYRLTGYRTCKNSEIPKHYTSAPTFSQAFRWFREKDRDIKIQKDPNGLYSGFFYWDGASWLVSQCEVYEEVELDCLQRLIEIEKAKSE